MVFPKALEKMYEGKDVNAGELQARDDAFRLHSLGVGSCFSPVHSSVALVVQAGMKYILLEVPSDPVMRFNLYCAALIDNNPCASEVELGIDGLTLDNVCDVIVSHSHKDHCGGLESLAFYKMFKQKSAISNGGPRIRLYGTQPVLARLRHDHHLNLEESHLDYEQFFDMQDLEPGVPVKIGGAELRVFPTKHGVPGFASMIHYRGRSIAYSGDTLFDAGLLRELSKADVLVHDCTGKDFGHTTPEQLRDWCRSSGYRGRLYACHYETEEGPRSAGLVPLKENEFIDI